MRTPELLCPAGSAPAMVAAVQCGADAVYLGAGEFNARKSADNFGGELASAVGYCHARDVKVYVTLNTMVRQNELDRLENTIREICLAGADGVIVQDFGVAKAVRQMAPSLPLHASTQMAVHNPQAVDFLVEQGFTRVVLAREMEYAEIARCANRGAELEVFVHGALCVSCSGQCLLSSLIGGRSGNRGMCAQPCRMKYRMDDKEGYLLSTKDLCGLDGLESLIQAGADSLKIEGRLKRPEYVAVTAAAYRDALSCLQDGRKPDIEKAKKSLAQMFNRGGFTKGYGFGADDAELMYHQRPNHIGTEIGRCRKNGDVELFESVDPRDALVLRRGGEDIPLQGMNFRDARKGDQLIRLVSQQQMLDAQQSFAGEHKKFPMDMRLQLKVGMPAVLELKNGPRSVRLEGETVQQAMNRPADPGRIRSQMEKLGDTIFFIQDYSAEIDENAYLPVSALNALRRTATEKLFEKRMGAPHACGSLELPNIEKTQPSSPELIVQSADPLILRRACAAGADFAVFAPEDLREQALDAAAEALPHRFDLALPAVMAENTLETLHAWAQKNALRIRKTLLSNVGQLGLEWPGEACGDLQLNIASNLSVARLSDWNIREYTPSVELNRSQIADLGGKKQLVVYGRLPLMYLRHCPLRASRKLQGLHKNCRRCDHADDCINRKSLTDRTGAQFPLRRIASDAGCVIQLRNSAHLMLLRRAASLPKADGWRLIMDESDPVEDIVRLHRAALAGEDFRSDPAWKQIEEMNTTTGHYFRGAE